MNENERWRELTDAGLDPTRGRSGSGDGATWQKDFAKLIETLEPNGNQLIEGFLAAQEVLASGFEQNFYNQVDDMGVPWKPRKDNLPHPLLIKTGRMFRAAVDTRNPEHFSDIRGTTLETGVSVPYAKFHHWGTSRMVARRVIYATEDTINRALEAFADAVEESLFE